MTVILINLYSHFSKKTSAQNKKCIVYCYLEKKLYLCTEFLTNRPNEDNLHFGDLRATDQLLAQSTS